MTKAYLEPEEILKMISNAGNPRDRLLVTMLFRLGCRVSEALGIAIDDIDLVNGCVTIKHLKQRIKMKCAHCGAGLGLSTVYCPKCGQIVEAAVKELKDHRKQRVLPLSEDLIALLKTYLSQHQPIHKNGKWLLFGINRHRAWQIIKNLGEKAGLPRIMNSETGKVHHVSPHKLRDAFAVNAVKHNDTGDGLRMLQEHLGHSSFNTTARYRKVASEELRHWYENLWK